MILADMHNHTTASHGTADVAAMAAQAKAAGLAWFGFSEHSPLPGGFSCALYTGDLAAEFPRYAAEVLRLREKSAQPGADGPRILLGLELDWLPSRPGYMRELVAAWPFDYVLGSLHYLDGMSVGAVANWGPEVPREERFARFAAYFYEMASMVKSGLVDVASHPDFIKLRAVDDFHAWLGAAESRAPLEAAVSALAESGTAMEVSAAGLRLDFAEPYPAPAIMRLAAEAGVDICFGSDAHRHADVGRPFDRLADYARSFGYAASVIFINRQKRRLAF
ncbi:MULTISPECIES: histidinol-phosphatase HisJ family protein [unclassified Desulfovibrio]|uniref:histidinol-phosphatase HisJ family protein n=1 Tax=unclassified Desulfovibrio TaxID=2593640 RepID=UPI0013EE368A|nr:MULTISPECIES: histidinol-phosphatase HisJ family protein [unclassified Desulfovibrio]